MICLIMLSIIDFSLGFNLCVVGASGGLGREIIYQAITERNLKVLGLSNKPLPIYKPFRGDGYEETKFMPQFKSKNLIIDSYWKDINYEYDHIVICVGSKPGEDDYSYTLTQKIIYNLPDKCKSISLISALGVNEDISCENARGKIFGLLFLRKIYKIKKLQEDLLNNFSCRKIIKNIYRPYALSYGNTYFDSISRYDLAYDILQDIFTQGNIH